MPFCLLSHLACLAVATSQSSVPLREILEPHGMSPLFIDRTINPVTDFYRYSNGIWLDNVRIAQSESQITAAGQARQRNAGIVRQLIQRAATQSTQEFGSPDQQVGDFFRVGMDEQLAERVGIRPLEEELRRIGAIETTRDVMAELGRLHRWSIFACFSAHPEFDPTDSTHKIITIHAAGLSLQSPDPYLLSDLKSIELRATYRSTVQKTLRSIGESPDSLAKSSENLLSIEETLARAAHTADRVPDLANELYPMKLADLDEEVPNVDWRLYFDRLGAPNPRLVRIGNLAYLKAFGKMLSEVPVSVWKSYLKWSLVNGAAPFLSDQFASEAFHLQSAVSGQQMARSREENVLSQTDASLGSELGQLLSRTEFSLDAKEKALSMVQTIRAALRDTISNSDWLSTVAKSKALEKLDGMRVSVCYPEHWRDTTGLSVKTDSYVENVFRAREFEFQRGLDCLAKPADRSEWEVNAYRVDAYYSKSLNMMVLPAGILQPPFFVLGGDEASNYGSLGAVIGHEFMHAFDDEGRKYDAQGNRNDWWCKSDEVRFKLYEEGMVSQFQGYNPMDKLKIDGRLTLAENIADLGGVKVAYRAFKKVEAREGSQTKNGLDADQRFFISFAQIFRSKIRPEVMRYGLENDAHSPPQFRVNGVLQNMPEFWKAFNSEPPGPVLSIW